MLWDENATRILIQDFRGYDYEHHARIETIELNHKVGEQSIA
jgi:hypothetical protein